MFPTCNACGNEYILIGDNNNAYLLKPPATYWCIRCLGQSMKFIMETDPELFERLKKRMGRGSGRKR